MSKLTLSTIESKFQQSHPFGTITKVSTNKYDVYFDSRDFRTDAEKELDLWNSSADTRKLYTYHASNLKQLAYKLNIELPEEEYKLSKLNQEYEDMRKLEREHPELFVYDEPLFFD
jgi:hypothetical protein